MAGLAIFVLVTSVLDALLTLLHLQNGGTEVNPFMQLAILEGTGVFLAWKTWVTGLSVAFLAPYADTPSGAQVTSTGPQGVSERSCVRHLSDVRERTRAVISCRERYKLRAVTTCHFDAVRQVLSGQ